MFGLKKKSFILFICLSVSIFMFSHSMSAATSKGIDFEDKFVIDDIGLDLHGVGLLKWKYLVDVYLVGLYKPEKIGIDQLLRNVPKRLEYYFFVDMKAHDFQSTGFELMARNIGEEKAKKLINELETFNAFYQDVKAGQRYTLTFVPGKGLEMALDGKVLGNVPGDEFGSAYLSIWLGPSPVSKRLQEGMFDPTTKNLAK